MKKLSEFDHITTPESWLEDALQIPKNNKPKVINLDMFYKESDTDSQSIKENQQSMHTGTNRSFNIRQRVRRHITKIFIAAALILVILSVGTIKYIAANGFSFPLTDKEKAINEKPFVIMLTGNDNDTADLSESSRSDANILVAVNPVTKKLAVISTDRDSYVYIDNSKRTDNRSDNKSGYDKLTDAGIFGMDTLKNTLQQLYNVNIDYYSKVNFSGLSAFIDALGGISVYSDYDFTSGLSAATTSYEFHQGYNECDGDMVLAFCRERKALPSETLRPQNQIYVVEGVLEKLMSSQTLYNYDAVVDAISNMMLTDMTKDTMVALMKEQVNSLVGWDTTAYYVGGKRSTQNLQVTGLKGASVILPEKESIDEARNQLRSVLQSK